MILCIMDEQNKPAQRMIQSNSNAIGHPRIAIYTNFFRIESNKFQ